MLSRLAHLTIRRRRLILVLAAIAFAVAGAIGGGVAEHLSSGGFDDPKSESSQAAGPPRGALRHRLPQPRAARHRRRGHRSTTPRSPAPASELTERLAAEPGVADVASYWSLGSPPPLRSTDATQALVVARIEGTQDDVVDRGGELADELSGPIDGGHGRGRRRGPGVPRGRHDDRARPRAGRDDRPADHDPPAAVHLPRRGRGRAAARDRRARRSSARSSCCRSWRRSPRCRSSPSTSRPRWASASPSTTACSSSPDTARSWPPGSSRAPAIVRTVRTAGRTVAFSALTVAASLCALLVFPLSFLRSFAYAGVVVAILAGLGAVVVLPALLAVLGHRVDALSLRRRAPKPVEEGIWHRVAAAVMRRPVPIATAVIVVLLLLGSPFRHLDLGLPDDRVLPASAEQPLRSTTRSAPTSTRRRPAPSPSSPPTRRAAGTGAARDAGDRRLRHHPVEARRRGPGRRGHRRLPRRPGRSRSARS